MFVGDSVSVFSDGVAREHKSNLREIFFITKLKGFTKVMTFKTSRQFIVVGYLADLLGAGASRKCIGASILTNFDFS